MGRICGKSCGCLHPPFLFFSYIDIRKTCAEPGARAERCTDEARAAKA